MSIWEYADGRRSHPSREYANFDTTCVYCSTSLWLDQTERDAAGYDSLNYGLSSGSRTDSDTLAGVCPACGWWKFSQITITPQHRGFAEHRAFDSRFGVLKVLDPADLSIPLGEIRSYLVARYDERFRIHPRIFEVVVGSVFQDLGYKVRVTSYSGDDGVDVILDDVHKGTVGVQVKRYKDRISVAQIRELTGALVIGGHTRGIFVTTSEFQAGAAHTAEMSAAEGYPIELMDALRFYDALKIGQLHTPRAVAEKKPWGHVLRWRP